MNKFRIFNFLRFADVTLISKTIEDLQLLPNLSRERLEVCQKLLRTKRTFNVNAESNTINNKGEILQVDEYNYLDEELKLNKDREKEIKDSSE